ncbi:hypothetical protein LINPERHAP2_LOCUS35426 [Linum perenne]
MTTFPKHVVLYSESVGKYANFSAGDPIQVNGKQAWSPFSRFEVRQSTNHPTMVHLRSSYNNKYLQLNPDNGYIYPSSISPIEDQTKVASTLFIPEFSATDGTFSLLLVLRGLYIKCYNNGSVYCLRAISPTSADPNCIFKFTDWQSLVMLPQHLSFKGDNGSYLGLLPESGAAMRFQIDDTANKTIAHELVALPDGTVRVKNASKGAFWRLKPGSSDGYILADDVTTTTDPTKGSVFKPYKVSNKVIALRNMENQLYCKRYTGEPKNSLSAKDSEITGYAKLALTELVTSRTIHDLKFNISIGWIYNKTEDVTLNGEGQVVTNETGQTRVIDSKIYYKDTKTTTTLTSTATSALKLGPTVTIQPDQIPVITDSSKIAMSDPFQKSCVWGEPTTQNSDQYKHHSITLPPWTMVTVQLKANIATCYTPFAYTRHDVLDEVTGQQPETHVMDDGDYYCTNYFDFTFHDSDPQPITKKN